MEVSQADGFRLLEVLPGHAPEPLTCRLFNADIKDWKDRYIALSYTWGQPVPENVQHSIILNG